MAWTRRLINTIRRRTLDRGRRSSSDRWVVLAAWIRGLLFQVNPLDPLTLAAATLGLIVVALLATLIPACRATRINPVIALRG